MCHNPCNIPSVYNSVYDNIPSVYNSVYDDIPSVYNYIHQAPVLLYTLGTYQQEWSPPSVYDNIPSVYNKTGDIAVAW